ncbi:MAG: EF-hand domain-containing protein [Phycisphaerales bacterium]
MLTTMTLVAAAAATAAGPSQTEQYQPSSVVTTQVSDGVVFTTRPLDPNVARPDVERFPDGVGQGVLFPSNFGKQDLAPISRPAGPIGSRAAFNDAYPGSPLETFEAYSGTGFNRLDRDTLDKSTDNAFFNPGDIDAGLRITVASSTPGSDPANFLMADEANTNYSSATVTYGSPQGPPDIIIDFLVPSTAIGLDVVGSPAGTAASVEVFSGETSLGVFPVNAAAGPGTFFGYESFGAPITRVEIDGGSFNGVDNIAYSRLCENFEDADLASGDFLQIVGDVIDRDTNDGVFSRGDIAPFLSVIPETSGNMFMTTSGFANYTSDAVTYGNNNAAGHELEILFSNGASEIDFDLTGNPDGSVATISLFSVGNFVASADFAGTGAGTNVGIFSPDQPITRITIDNTGTGGFNGVDNICFDPCETFEEFVLDPGGLDSTLPQTIDANTSTATVPLGSIAAGLSITTTGNNTVSVTTGFASYTTDALSYNNRQTGPEQVVEFDGGASFVSLDVQGNPPGTVVNVEAFAGAASLGVIPVTTVAGGTPVSFSGDRITRLTLDNPSAAGFHGVDNICFVPFFCFCDCDGNGTINIDDIDCFVAGFLGGDTGVADCDGNGSINIDDIDCFVACFLAGCP